jgi:hypothetical protein
MKQCLLFRENISFFYLTIMTLLKFNFNYFNKIKNISTIEIQYQLLTATILEEFYITISY